MKFEIEWEADDGYAGKSRPQKFEIDYAEIDWCGNIETLKYEIHHLVRTDFENKVRPYCKNMEEIIEYWLKIKGGLNGI